MKNLGSVEEHQNVVQGQPENIAQEQPKHTKIEVQVERFPFAKEKFSKESWDSGEGGGGEHDGGER